MSQSSVLGSLWETGVIFLPSVFIIHILITHSHTVQLRCLFFQTSLSNCLLNFQLYSSKHLKLTLSDIELIMSLLPVKLAFPQGFILSVNGTSIYSVTQLRSQVSSLTFCDIVIYNISHSPFFHSLQPIYYIQFPQFFRFLSIPVTLMSFLHNCSLLQCCLILLGNCTQSCRAGHNPPMPLNGSHLSQTSGLMS